MELRYCVYHSQMPPGCYFTVLLTEKGGGDFFMPTLVSTLSFSVGSFFLKRFLHFIHFLHLFLQQNWRMAMLKRMIRMPKPTTTPTAEEFTVLPLFPMADQDDQCYDRESFPRPLVRFFILFKYCVNLS